MIKTKKKTASNKKTPAKRSSGMALTDRRAVRVIAAVTLALLLLMIGLACVSYLFTGAGDQSVQPGERYGNLLGKAGYFLAHALMSRMGLATFFILTVGFALTGILALDKPFSRIALFCAKTIGAALWFSVLLAYFSSEYSGAWGYRLNDLLQGYIGWGLAILLALAVLLVMSVLMTLSTRFKSGAFWKTRSFSISCAFLRARCGQLEPAFPTAQSICRSTGRQV